MNGRFATLKDLEGKEYVFQILVIEFFFRIDAFFFIFCLKPFYYDGFHLIVRNYFILHPKHWSNFRLEVFRTGVPV